MNDDENHIHGTPEEVIRALAQEVAAGRMSAEQLAELTTALHRGEEALHDVSVGFRVALIMQGFESMALQLIHVGMALTQAGAMFSYGVSEDKAPDWLDNLGPAETRALLVASVMVLRAGNVDAEIAEDGVHIGIRGKIRDDDEVSHDAIVREFVNELNEIFPDVPPSKPRQGEWW